MENPLVAKPDSTGSKTFVVAAPEHGLTYVGVAMAIISTIIGGGIVGFSYALYYTGIAAGTILIFVMAIQLVASVKLYLASKDIIPGNPMSLYEIGYALYKRASIFFISGILVFNSFGMMLIYFILFGNTLSSIIVNVWHVDNFFSKRAAYVLILGLLLTPLILKKEMNELKAMSFTLFGAISVFIVLTIVQLSVAGVHKFNVDFPEGSDFQFFYPDYYKPKFNSVDILKGFNIVLVGFTCQQNLFPLFQELKTQTNQECVKGFSLASGLVGLYYLLLALVGLYMFGSVASSSLLDNMADECNGDDCPWPSILLRFIFMVVLACHIPFIFFSGKEGMLIIIDELDRKTISTALEQKVDFLQHKESAVGSYQSIHLKNTLKQSEVSSRFKGSTHKDSVTNSVRDIRFRASEEGSKIKLAKSLVNSIPRPTQELRNMVKNSMALKEEDPAVKFSGYKVKAEGEEAAGSYKSMKACYYYSSTLIMFGLEVGISCLVEEVTSVFDIVAAISVACLGFLFPAFFFLKAYKVFLRDDEKKQYSGKVCLAYLHVALGVLAFVVGMASNIISFVQNDPDDK